MAPRTTRAAVSMDYLLEGATNEATTRIPAGQQKTRAGARVFSLTFSLARSTASLRPGGLRLAFDDRCGHVRRDRCVGSEFHRVGGASLGHGAELRRVAEHLGERHFGVDDLHAGAIAHLLDGAALGGEVADDVAHELLGGEHLDLHDRLEEDRSGLLAGVLERHGTGDLEGDFVRVDVVVGAVVDGDLHVDDRVAGLDAAIERFLHALLDGGDELARDGAAGDLVDELVAFAAGLRLDPQVTMAVLAAAARLLDVLAFGLGVLGDGLAVRDLRPAHVAFHLVLALHAVDDDVEVKLAHAGNDELVGLFVGPDAERRVLFGQFLERDAHLLLVRLGLRLDGERDDRFGEGDVLEHDRPVLVAEGVAGEGRLEAHGGGDVAGLDLIDVLARVGVQAHDAADALAIAGGRVQHVGTGFERAGIDAEEAELADERVRRDLERERRERRVVLGRALHDLRLVVRLGAFHRRDVERRRKVVDDGVEHELHALVLEGAAAEDGHDLERDDRLAEHALEFGDRDLLAGEELLDHGLVAAGGDDGLDQLRAVFLGLGLHVLRVLAFLDLLAHVV